MKSNSDREVQSAITDALNVVGRERLLTALKTLRDSSNRNPLTLTLIVNSGVHPLPLEYARGEVFTCSEGSLDFSSSAAIHEEFHRILSRTARKLKSRDWQRVYVVPFGPATLSMQIKLLVYRVSGLESIDVMHVSGRQRVDLSFDLRQIIIDSDMVAETQRLAEERAS